MEPTGILLDYPAGHFLTRTVIKSSAQIIGMEIHCNKTTSLQEVFLNAPPNFSSKNELQPIRAAFQEIFNVKSSSLAEHGCFMLVLKIGRTSLRLLDKASMEKALERYDKVDKEP